MRKYLLGFMLLVTTLPALCQWNSNTTVNNVVSNSNRDELIAGSVSDGANGSIIFMQDQNSHTDIFAQKISSAGAIAWGSTASPVPVCVTQQDKEELNAIPDGAGGAFVAWRDDRTGDMGEIYIQRINGAGIVQWSANGVQVTNTADRDDSEPVLCSDGAGGVIVTWYWDDAVNKNIQSSAQRYNGAGVQQWAANGVQVCTAPGFRGANTILSDGSNGAIISFLDTRDDVHGQDYDYFDNDDNEIQNANIYAQRLDGNGARKWTNNGAAVITAGGNQQSEKAIPDGNGGAIFVFDDGRNDDGNFNNYDVFAQRLNANGAMLWLAGGVAVSTAAGTQILTGVATDGAGGVVASFENNSGAVYGQRITAAGTASWTTNGVAVVQQSQDAFSVPIIADGNGNTIFAYTTTVNDISTVRAQKINSAGLLQWATAGITISDLNLSYVDDVDMVLSDNGSVIIAWNDSRGVTSRDIYASKVLTSGTLAGAAVNSYVSAANGNWNNPSTWVGGVVPPAGATVTIHHAVSCNISTSCSTLKIEQPGGNLTVLTGFNLTVTQ